MEQVQRNFYMKSRAAQVESGGKTFEVWPGYTFSINIYEAGLFLVSNVRAKVMPNYNVLDILNATYIECRDKLQSGRCSNISFNELFRTEAIRRVCGIQVFYIIDCIIQLTLRSRTDVFKDNSTKTVGL